MERSEVSDPSSSPSSSPSSLHHPHHSICYNMCTQRNPFNWSEQLYAKHNEVWAEEGGREGRREGGKEGGGKVEGKEGVQEALGMPSLARH